MAKKIKDQVKIHSDQSFKSPYDFKSMPYDQRSSSFISAGNQFGVGKRQPIGKTGEPSNQGPIPFGKIDMHKHVDVDAKRFDVM